MGRISDLYYISSALPPSGLQCVCQQELQQSVLDQKVTDDSNKELGQWRGKADAQVPDDTMGSLYQP